MDTEAWHLQEAKTNDTKKPIASAAEYCNFTHDKRGNLHSLLTGPLHVEQTKVLTDTQSVYKMSPRGFQEVG